MSNVAQTILDQLGGQRFVAMTGARSLVSGPDYLAFALPRGNRLRANRVVIRLTRRDDYEVEFMQLKRYDIETAHRVEGVYAENLRSTFEAATGLRTSL